VTRAGAKIGRVLFTKEEIEARLDVLAGEIQERYAGGELTVVAVLKGSLFFTADLMKRLKIPVRMDIIEISSYSGGVTPAPSGEKTLSKYIADDVHDRDVLVVDDILDTGGTLAEVLGLLRAENPRSLATCVFLVKKRKRRLKVPIDFCGFEVKARDFVVGYGLDYAQRYRNLPYLAVLKGVGKSKRGTKTSSRRKPAAVKKTRRKTASGERTGDSRKKRRPRPVSSGRRRKRGGRS